MTDKDKTIYVVSPEGAAKFHREVQVVHERLDDLDDEREAFLRGIMEGIRYTLTGDKPDLTDEWDDDDDEGMDW